MVHNSQEMRQMFPENTVNFTFRRNKILKELISPFLFPRVIKENKCSVEKCNRRCDTCKTVLVLSIEFTLYPTKRKYEIRGFLTYNTKKCYLSASM